VPTCAQFGLAHRLCLAHEPRDLNYRVAAFLVEQALGLIAPSTRAEALALLLEPPPSRSTRQHRDRGAPIARILGLCSRRLSRLSAPNWSAHLSIASRLLASTCFEASQIRSWRALKRLAHAHAKRSPWPPRELDDRAECGCVAKRALRLMKLNFAPIGAMHAPPASPKPGPRMNAREKTNRDNQIVAARMRGQSWTTIAANYGLSERQCQNVLADYRASHPRETM
jgi:hypothetical protein